MRCELEGGSRRNTSLDKLGMAPMGIIIIKVTFQEAPVTGMCIINIQG